MSLIMKNITKEYPNVKALDNINIEFKDGGVIGLIGFNGSGKTTSFNVLTNLIEDYDGDVLIRDEDGVERKMQQSDLKLFSYLASGFEPQNQETALNQLSYMGSLHGLNKKETLERIGDVIKVLGFEDKIKKPIKSLSKGNQQKIKLIGAFVNPNAKYLLLDEPFDGLDPIMVEKIKNYILSTKGDKTIIITSHRMEVVDQMCDSFFVLKDGILVDSKVENSSDATVSMSVNLEVPITAIKEIKDVLSVVKNNREYIIQIKDIASFKGVNKKLIAHPKYIWSSLREKKLTESVFERYADE